VTISGLVQGVVVHCRGCIEVGVVARDMAFATAGMTVPLSTADLPGEISPRFTPGVDLAQLASAAEPCKLSM
jgi:hypothetical protein